MSLWTHDAANEYTRLDPDAERFCPVRDPDGWWSAVIRHDGCVDLRRYHNESLDYSDDEKHPQLIDYIHICDVDDLIERLQDLTYVAKQHFGEDWK